MLNINQPVSAQRQLPVSQKNSNEQKLREQNLMHCLVRRIDKPLKNIFGATSCRFCGGSGSR